MFRVFLGRGIEISASQYYNNVQVTNLGNSLPGAVGAIIDCFPYVIRFTLKISVSFSHLTMKYKACLC